MQNVRQERATHALPREWNLLRRCITEIIAADEIDEASGAGAAMGTVAGAWSAPGEDGPGWVEPKGFALRSSKRKRKHARKKS